MRNMDVPVWLRLIDRGCGQHIPFYCLSQASSQGAWRCGRFGKSLFIGLMFWCCPLLLAAQGTPDSLIQEISVQILALINQNLEKDQETVFAQDFAASDELFNLSEPRLELASKELIYKYRIQEAKKNLGINLRGQYLLNYDAAFENDNNEDVFTGTRARIGLEWQILNQGWLGQRAKAKRLEKEQQLDALKHSLSENDQRLYFRYNVLIYLFNEAKIKLLKARLAQLNRQLELLYKVYFLKGILYEEIIEVKSKLEQANVQLSNYEEYNHWVEKTLDLVGIKNKYRIEGLPVLKVDLDFLLEDESKTRLLDSIAHLEEAIALQGNKAINDISIRLQAYQNIGFTEDLLSLNRTYASFGVGVTIPTEIFYNRKTKENLAYAKLRERLKFNNYEQLNTASEIINYHYEYSYKLKTYMQFIHKEMLYREKIRMEVVSQKNYLDIYRSLRILRYMDVLRNIQLEVLDLKQQMYLLLLKIYGKTHYESLQSFVRPLEVADFYERLPAKRSLVLEENALRQFDQFFIKDYLLTNAFERVIVEESSAGASQAFLDLQDLLKSSSIKVDRRLNNQRLLSTRDEGASEIVNTLLKEDFDGVVLDFSTQNSAAWRTKTRDYLVRKFDFFANADRRQKAKPTSINVKLSKGYPLEFILTLAKEVDQVTLQLDQEGDLRYLEELTKRGFTEMGKLCLSINASGFKDRIEMEAFIDMVHSVYDINNVVIDGLTDFIALDTKAFIKPE
ncbi:MAG: hypothetical protein AAGD05_09265 [Bacteroidota bacterium]